MSGPPDGAGGCPPGQPRRPHRPGSATTQKKATAIFPRGRLSGRRRLSGLKADWCYCLNERCRRDSHSEGERLSEAAWRDALLPERAPHWQGVWADPDSIAAGEFADCRLLVNDTHGVSLTAAEAAVPRQSPRNGLTGERTPAIPGGIRPVSHTRGTRPEATG